MTQKKKEYVYMTENELISRAAALLDHYSSRAVAHASFFVASIFGLITFTALASEGFVDMGNVWYYFLCTYLFWIFAYLGHYTLRRFNSYASIAEAIAKKGLNEKDVFEKLGILDLFKTQYDRQKSSLVLKAILSLETVSTPFLISAYWIAVVFLDLVNFFKFSNQSGWHSLVFFLPWMVVPLGLVALFEIYAARKQAKRNS
jgi:hypothetical protein